MSLVGTTRFKGEAGALHSLGGVECPTRLRRPMAGGHRAAKHAAQRNNQGRVPAANPRQDHSLVSPRGTLACAYGVQTEQKTRSTSPPQPRTSGRWRRSSGPKVRSCLSNRGIIHAGAPSPDRLSPRRLLQQNRAQCCRARKSCWSCPIAPRQEPCAVGRGALAPVSLPQASASAPFSYPLSDLDRSSSPSRSEPGSRPRTPSDNQA